MKSLTFSPQGVLNLHDIDIAWSLAIAENQDMPLAIVETSDMTSFEIKNQDGEFLTIWTGNSLLGENFKVIISWIKDEGTGLYQGKLSWQNNTSNYYIEEVHFPAIKAKVSEDSKFFKPDNCGELASMRYVAQKGKRWFYCSMQWTALFPANKDYGYYFDCKDSEHYIKQYDFFYKDNTFIHDSVFYVPLLEENKAQFSMPYSCSMGKFTGSWYEAALLYKSWAINQSWYLNRLPVKEKLYNTAMWVWNRGTSNEVIPPVQKLRSDAKVPVALDNIIPGKTFLNAYHNISALQFYVDIKGVEIREKASSIIEDATNPLNNPKNLGNTIAALAKFTDFKNSVLHHM